MLAKEKAQLKLKLLIVGDSGVGKTSIMMRYANDQFQEDYLSTVGVDFKVKKIEGQNYKATLNIWDTAGQERFRTITKNFYKGSDGVVLVYSITDPLSFAHIDSWVSQIQNHCESEVNIVLLACKSDLENDRKVRKEEGLKVAQKYGVGFYQVSAKTNQGLEESFSHLTNQILSKRQANVTEAQFQNSEIGSKITKDKLKPLCTKKTSICC